MTNYTITLTHDAYGTVRETVDARTDRSALRHASADQRRAVTAPRADAWNAWRWLDDEGTRCVCVASEQTLDAAMDAARRLGAHQVQHGLDGRVEVVS